MAMGRVAGVRVRAHPLLLAVLGVALAGGQAVEALVLLALLLGHELAHLLAARAFGLPVDEVVLYPFGGVARSPGVAEAEGAVESFVAAAGPLHNLFLLAVARWLDDRGVLDPGLGTLFVEGNSALALFNLLPVLPLDGGRILRGMLARRAGLVLVTRRLALAGQTLGGVLTAAGGVLSLAGWFAPNAFVLGLLLWAAAAREREAAAWLRASYAWRREDMLARGVVPVRELAAPAGTPVGEVLRWFAPGNYHLVWVLDERQAPLALVEESALLAAARRLGLRAPLDSLLDRAAP